MPRSPISGNDPAAPFPKILFSGSVPGELKSLGGDCEWFGASRSESGASEGAPKSRDRSSDEPGALHPPGSGPEGLGVRSDSGGCEGAPRPCDSSGEPDALISVRGGRGDTPKHVVDCVRGPECTFVKL